MVDVLITFAPQDAELALRIQKSLERAGISATRGPSQYTQNWAQRLMDELDACSSVLALWSRNALETDWVLSEAAIGAHFGQTISLRTDITLERDTIPALFRDAGEIVDVFEGDIAPDGWGRNANENLDRRLAAVFGRIRSLKARGPLTTPSGSAATLLPAEEVQRRLSGGFSWSRHAGAKAGGSMPALAATRREAAFRAAYNAFASMDYPADIRAGLAEFADTSTARRGLARIYGEALSRNDQDFWGLLGRLAAPLSQTLSLGALQRAGEPATTIAELIDPRDAREMHGERFARGRQKAGGGGIPAWPIAAVAVGLLALVAAPQVQKFAGSFDTASLDGPDAKVRPIESTEIAPPPFANGEKTIRAAPLPTLPPKSETIPAAVTPPPPPPANTSLAVAAPPVPASAELAQVARLKFCRLAPKPNEIVLEVMEGERLFDVAGRAFMDSPAGIAQIAARNAGCLEGRALSLVDGRLIGGSDLLFAGDRLVIPASKATNATNAAPASSTL